MSDLFNLDNDIFQPGDDDPKSHFAVAIGIMIRAVLALTTGGFFYLFAPDLLAWLVGNEYAAFGSAAVGVFCIDVMAWFWNTQRQAQNKSTEQLEIATYGTVGNICISVLVTTIFFILLTDFVATTNPDGTLNNLGTLVNIIGLGVGTLAIGGNGVLWAYFEAKSPTAIKQASAAKLDAARQRAAARLEEARTQLTVDRTIEGIRQQLPQLTAQAGNENTNLYVSRFFNQADRDGDGRVSNAELARWVAQNPDAANRLLNQIQSEQIAPTTPRITEPTHDAARQQNGRSNGAVNP